MGLAGVARGTSELKGGADGARQKTTIKELEMPREVTTGHKNVSSRLGLAASATDSRRGLAQLLLVTHYDCGCEWAPLMCCGANEIRSIANSTSRGARICLCVASSLCFVQQRRRRPIGRIEFVSLAIVFHHVSCNVVLLRLGQEAAAR